MTDRSVNLWAVVEGDGPVVATAIHDGHELRPAVAELMKLGKEDRLREEDPHTGYLAAVASTHVIPRRSRFEVDLNRPRERAVYRKPDDAWGLDVWREPPDDALVEDSLASYDAFYEEMGRRFRALAEEFGAFVVLDVHSYNHRRMGPEASPDDPDENPEVNLGTGTMERGRWAPIVDRFIRDLSGYEQGGRRLDVRENVKFFGGNLARSTHSAYRDSGCVLAVEFRKSFMDEWSGEVNGDHLAFLRAALESTLPGIVEEVTKIGSNIKRGAR